MKANEYDEMVKKSKVDDDSSWESPLRLSPEEMAEREAAAQILVERERHRLRMEEQKAAREAEAQARAEQAELEKKERAAKKRRLGAEEKRLRESYKDLPPDLMRIADGLIQRAAFMRLTLEEYERDLEENGYVEMFSQSANADPYERERPVARLYNTMNKNYQSIIKQLADLVPPPPPVPKTPPPPDDFEKLLGRGSGNGNAGG